MPLSISSRWETAVDAVLVSCNPPLAAQRCCASPEPWAAPPFTAANAIVVLNAGLGFRQSRLLILPPAHGEHGAVRSAIHLSQRCGFPEHLSGDPPQRAEPIERAIWLRDRVDHEASGNKLGAHVSREHWVGRLGRFDSLAPKRWRVSSGTAKADVERYDALLTRDTRHAS